MPCGSRKKAEGILTQWNCCVLLTDQFPRLWRVGHPPTCKDNFLNWILLWPEEMYSYFPVPLPLILCYSSWSWVGWNMPKLLFTIITSPGYCTVYTRLPEASRILLEPMTPSSFYSRLHNRTAFGLSCLCSSSLVTCLIISIFIVNAWLSSKFTKGSCRLSFVKICFSFN